MNYYFILFRNIMSNREQYVVTHRVFLRCTKILIKFVTQQNRGVLSIQFFKSQNPNLPFTFKTGLSNNTASSNTQFQQPISAHTDGWFCTQSTITTLPMIAPLGNPSKENLCSLATSLWRKFNGLSLQPTTVFEAWISTLCPMYS